jgi:hypothetical protein
MDTLQAAEQLGVKERWLRRLCTQGRIVSQRTGKLAVLTGRKPEWDIPDDPIILTKEEGRKRLAREEQRKQRTGVEKNDK